MTLIVRYYSTYKQRVSILGRLDMKENNQPAMSNVLGPQDMLDMIRHLVRVNKLYRSFRDHIKPHYFCIAPPPGGFSEESLLYIWKALELYYAKQGEGSPPSKVMLTTYVREVLLQGYSPDQSVLDVLFGSSINRSCLDYIYDGNDEDFNELSGEPLVKAFVYQRDIVPATKAMQAALGDDKVIDVTDQLRGLAEQAERVQSIGAEYEIFSSAPSLDFFATLEEDPLLTTGVTVIDNFIGGGALVGECNGISGPNGSGKSTLAVNMLVGSARDEWQLKQDNSDLCVYYTYEMTALQTLARIWSDAYNISRKSLSPYGGLVNPSTSFETMKPYEKELYRSIDANNKDMYESEYERWMTNSNWVHKVIQVRNFSGTADKGDNAETARVKRAKGKGGIPEIVNDLEYLMEKTGRGLRLVIIDYANKCAGRYLGFDAASDSSKMAAFLTTFADQCTQQIANMYQCTVWALNQTQGQFGKEGPLKIPTHFHGAQCSTFAENMPNFMCLGNPDSGGGGRERCLWLNPSKTRNAGAGDHGLQPAIMQFDKHIAHMNDVTLEYQPSPRLKRFVRRDGDAFEGI